MFKGFSEYSNDWEEFRKYIENKAKNRCTINNKNWLKLRDFHFKRFIETVSSPYNFTFKMIYIKKMQKKIPCIYRVYYKYKKQEEEKNSMRLKTRIQAFRKYR